MQHKATIIEHLTISCMAINGGRTLAVSVNTEMTTSQQPTFNPCICTYGWHGLLRQHQCY